MTRLAFAPHIPLSLLGILIAVAAAITIFGLWRRARGALMRGLAFAILLFALAGPILVKETRTALPDVVALVVDRSQSMGVGKRSAQADAALARLRQDLRKQPNLTVRETSIATTTTGENNGTQAFAALGGALSDVPPSRIAGAIMITDGEVHDAPERLSLRAPLQVLIAGEHGERDRKLTVSNAERFAIVGQSAQLVLRVDDFGGGGAGGTAEVSVSVDGKPLATKVVQVGRDATLKIPVTHEGENIVELAAAPGPSELTLQNNRAVVSISGVRDHLRVLLISGEPHAGERVWRNLLKSDPSVDLVHFTILRPPNKQDATPIEELSLIVFPTRELFLEKLKSFDLVIFDRYGEAGILPMAYFENIANYVDDGGALLVSSGPEFASEQSLYHTPLASVLPAQPSGEILAQGFKPMVTPTGLAHPVTRDLPGSNTESSPQPSWGRWFRLIGASNIAGQTVMNGSGNRPLLVLDQVKKGRVAELMSDQIWLWARGYEGGGPQAELLRRLAHWLMKEPELEAENLSASVVEGEMVVTRRTMAPTAQPVEMTMPSGRQAGIPLSRIEPGVWRGSMKVNELGLYRLTDGALSAVTAAGPLNPKEVADMRATADILGPLAKESGGSVHWLTDGMVNVRRVAPAQTAYGSNWIGLRRNGAYRVTSLEQEPLLPPWAALLLVVGSLVLAWRIEGR